MENRVELMQQKVSGAFAKAATTSKAVADCAGSGRPGTSDYKNAERVLYVTGEITSSGQNEYFQAILKKETGVTNFDRNRLNPGRNGVATSAKFEYATIVTAGNEAVDWKAAVKVADFSEECPGTLKNSETMFEDSVKPLIVLPVSELHNPNVTRSNDELYRSLGDLRVLEADTDFKLTIKFPEGAAPLDAAKRHFFRYTIRVGETVSR
ncbi:hypothetical protein [Lacinutrix sp. Hel_I_90]|uniref:hypothetical protein n=1 Tax=Lacinutrix sp. Hel_I_90 TaxID=1249999 RepID=UPI0005CB0558|nr:hypothetical protein [Lacinutrix sp. Hel_I_90]